MLVDIPWEALQWLICVHIFK